ncbi:amino acid adenylation domain-containing protein [Pseudomonas xanthosomatis]|uniref:amino acid adenylation domain-containing protein n=1 Tax=Pseudomonas xanthosomatis TaxID=2842356 RepID=UPI003517C2C3
MQELIESIGVLSAQERKALAVLLKKEGVNLYDIAPVFRRDPAEPLRLSYAQDRQWFLWQLEPGSAAYHIPAALRLHGPLNLAALQQGFDYLLARHESLRTTIDAAAGQALQRVAAHQVLALQVEDSGALSPEALQARIEEQVRQPFDLAAGPLLRVRLLRLAEDEHVLVMVLHHIVADGWSMQILVRELVQAYQAFCQGHAPAHEALAIQYPDYALWQRAWMEAGERQRQLDYWTAQLGGEQPVLELPLDHPRPAAQSYLGARHDLQVPAPLVQGLQRVASEHGVTLFTLLLASFQVLLYRYSGQADLRIGIPNANRNRPETQGLIGFFVNTQVLKAELHGRMSLRQVLAQAADTVLQAQAHQDLPFEQLVEALQPERSLSHSPLFQAMYSHQNASREVSATGQLAQLRIDSLDFDSQAAQFDLSLDTAETADGLLASFTYMRELFQPATIARLAGHWHNLLQALLADIDQAIGEVDLLDAPQRQQLQHQWSGVDGLHVSDQYSLKALIEAQVERSPDAVALIHEGQQLSYRQMNTQANRLAARLLAAGVGPEQRVGIAVARGLDMVIAVLAVLKSGAAYVPMDPQYPRERLQCMIEDAGLACLLSQPALRGQLPDCGTLAVLELEPLATAAQDPGNPAQRSLPGNLAYVMFTSGSTGRPKGVAITQAALAAHVQVCIDFFGLVPADRVLQFATFNFDGFVEQLFPPLICGAAVLLRGNEIWSSEQFHQALVTQGVTVADLTTAYWAMLAKDFAAQPRASYGGLRQVHAGGEAMAADALAAWQAAGLQGVRLLNTYGPTEATVTVSAHDCAAARPARGNPPIGQVLAGRSLYVVDGHGGLAPVGVVGELLIGGELLARGYFQRPDLSAWRFVPDPFGAPGARLYRTGDLVRRLANGDIEYVGRTDHQIKLRGFRIELGEIEARLAEHPAVREALVVPVQGAAGLQLVGYLVARQMPGDDPGPWLREVQAWLKTRLPDYMVPAQLMVLAAMPLSPNGKLDRRALPAPDPQWLASHYLAPRSELEQRIAGIWQALLGVPQVGLNDNFFELGGHSLLATQVMARVQVELGANIPLSLLFQESTLEGFAQAVQPLLSQDMDETLDELNDFLNALEAN